ncbi:hypothetical protein F4861DRAFT_533464 [Xylaria intraflava]|nr:hypothetical protein F4861DRAFT_533464 [Xylaria intraflava]
MASRKAKDVKDVKDVKVADDVQFANAIPFQVLRSDGTEMPSEYNQYEKVEPGSKAVIEWQNKLGQALAAELMPEANSAYFLQEFPAHYHLRWYQDDKRKPAIHYYLFGYPEDISSFNKARKYYRSPNHFLPHLIWLIGESEDKGDCACEFCSGSKPITSKSAKPKVVTATEQISSPSSVPTTSATPSVLTSSVPTGSPAISSIADGGPGTTAAVADIPSDSILFRAGEVVWYKNNNSWRVGMVLTPGATLSIIPFGHPLYPTQAVIKEEADIRPFLAFSVPQINKALEAFKGQALSQINWPVLQTRLGVLADPSRQEARREGLAIEATKLAATRVDQCYSPFDPYHSQPQSTFYWGVFLGAEKICVGEAVRINPMRDQREEAQDKGLPTVMVVNRIKCSGKLGEKDEELTFSGSIWTLRHASLTQPQQQTYAPEELPASMLGEKTFRDGILIDRGLCVHWVPVVSSITLVEASIRGRFYETQRLTPILSPSKFQDMFHQRTVEEIQTLLNNRADSRGPRVGRVRNRAQAVAGAVPADVLASMNLGVKED